MSTLFYFIVTIGVLVSFHEFGHFWVARKVGVKVLRFSVGFGRVLWSYRKGPESTEYVISAIPLGGYVKMVDEREGEVKSEDLPYAFNRQKLSARSAIVAAGPVFNLILAVVLFWVVLVVGEEGTRPILGKIEAGTLAAEAGLLEGDEFVAVNDKRTPTWSETLNVLIGAALDSDREIKLLVKDKQGREEERWIKLTGADVEDPEKLYKRLGFNPWMPRLRPVIDKVLPEGAALAAGMKSGDIVISADGTPIADWQQWVEYVKNRPGRPIKAEIERDDARLTLTITPKTVEMPRTEEGEAPKAEGKIGASVVIPEEVKSALKVEYALGPLEAIPAAFTRTYDYSFSTLKMMGKMVLGQASVKNLSGPISIAQYAGESAEIGFVHFLKFIALVSVSLGILNLLPIPVLDGGHLVFFGIEAIKGEPLSEKSQLFFQQIGLAILVTLMALGMVMDIQRLFQ
ncbi:RIP metalloprotease RseP [Candidatus Methylomicrobium oryzae]|jgi:regulator of sigma E protease|uniref:RIP metalloprotease RseP n=1 Tax=Candidatus Methylomicrobium oryzae TaxID=2802053 RepID=UPI0019229B52|nr:RIP metalloprotease RseP [Methylomicrobium sp. RS1]MBL1265517.1 RIP metalloprotease RseP [Methylomicrobium sp. RS1]